MKICFCSYSIPKYRVGGAERQMFNMAREMVERGHEVHMTTRKFSEDQPWDEEVEGVKVHAFSEEPKHKLLKSYFRALRKADADIYHNRAATSITGLTALYTKVFGGKFVYTVAHEEEYSEYFLENDLSFLREKSFLYGLKNADQIITLSKDMQKGLKDKMDIDSEVIYSGYPSREAPSWDEKENLVIWISRFVDWKRPEKFLELAEETDLEGWKFALIGYGDEEYEEELKERSEDIENLEYIGKVEPGNDWGWYRRAKLLVNTSTKEGFPNTFIQAWMMGTPVASLGVDPDNLIENHKTGIKDSAVSALSDQIESEISELSLKEKSTRSRKLYEEKFDIEQTVDKHMELYEEK
jgi:glycosyltransferase involved in cell wall biosynthesis